MPFTTSAASANTKSNWSEVIKGVEIGWTNNHAWAIASYATVIALGAGEIASLGCDALTEDAGVGFACSEAVEMVVAEFAKGHPDVTNHGIWVAVYPQWDLRVTVDGGTY